MNSLVAKNCVRYESELGRLPTFLVQRICHPKLYEQTERRATSWRLTGMPMTKPLINHSDWSLWRQQPHISPSPQSEFQCLPLKY